MVYQIELSRKYNDRKKWEKPGIISFFCNGEFVMCGNYKAAVKEVLSYGCKKTFLSNTWLKKDDNSVCIYRIQKIKDESK